MSETRGGLNVSLLARDVDTGRLYVNLDSSVIELIQEAKLLLAFGFEVPDLAVLLVKREAILKNTYTTYIRLHYTLSWSDLSTVSLLRQC